MESKANEVTRAKNAATALAGQRSSQKCIQQFSHSDRVREFQ